MPKLRLPKYNPDDMNKMIKGEKGYFFVRMASACKLFCFPEKLLLLGKPSWYGGY